MNCPRCNSTRIQRDFDNASPLARLAGLKKLLCNECGHVFQGFDPFGRVSRKPTKRDPNFANRRRGVRFRVHFPTSISLLPTAGQRLTSSTPSQGHCEVINEYGMGLSLVGSRFSEEELTKIGQRLLIHLRLPEASVEAVVAICNHRQITEGQKKKWFIGVKLTQISDSDKANLTNYLKTRSERVTLEI